MSDTRLGNKDYMVRTTGVAVFLIESHKVLMGLRSDTVNRGAGCWTVPGGLMDKGESVQDCVIREMQEETGLFVRCSDTPVIGATDFPSIKHLTLWCYAYAYTGVLENKELEKCKGFTWWDLRDFFKTVKQTQEQIYWTPASQWRLMLNDFGLRF